MKKKIIIDRVQNVSNKDAKLLIEAPRICDLDFKKLSKWREKSRKVSITI